MNILISWLVSALVILTASYILPGVHVENFTAALVTAIVLGVINLFIKPFILLLTLPITLVTFGLFALVINAALILLAGSVVPGFTVDGFWWALLFSIVLSLINAFLNSANKQPQTK
jgi:putative membrane protein